MLILILIIIGSIILANLIGCFDMNDFKLEPSLAQFKRECKWLWNWTVKKLTNKSTNNKNQA